MCFKKISLKLFKDVSRIIKWSFYCNFVAWILSQLPEQKEGLFYYNCFNWILLWLPLTMKLCVCFFTAIKRIEKDKDTDYAPCYKNILGSMLTNFAFYCFLSNCPNFFLLWNLYWSWNFLVASKGDLFKNCLLFLCEDLRYIEEYPMWYF